MSSLSIILTACSLVVGNSWQQVLLSASKVGTINTYNIQLQLQTMNTVQCLNILATNSEHLGQCLNIKATNSGPWSMPKHSSYKQGTLVNA